MAAITLKGNTIETSGQLPAAGETAPDFTLVNSKFEEVSLSSFSGKQIVLNIFPSIDTPVCAASVRRFNDEAGKRPDTAVLCISADLPFAHSRFCGAEGLENVFTLSAFRNPRFGKDYGAVMTTGPLKGLLSRAVIVISRDMKIKYTEQVPEIGQEPDYEAAMAVLE